jgi:hypothetical protein
MRTNEENTIEQNKILNERRLLATDTLNTFNRLNHNKLLIVIFNSIRYLLLQSQEKQTV